MSRLASAVAASAALCVVALAPQAQAAPTRATLEGDLPPDLKAAILRAIGETDRPIENRFEARRRARDAAEDAIAVLRSEGYYAYVVDPEVGDEDAPMPVVRVTPGPRFNLAQPVLEWGDAPPDSQTIDAAHIALGLTDGQPGRAADVVAAEGRALVVVKQHGYADAAAAPREVVVDHADHTVQPTYHLVAGQLVRLDGVQVTTAGRTSAAWVARLAPWKAGQTFDPSALAELERRLVDAGVFDSVTVALAPVGAATPEGYRPVVVSLSERKPHSLEVGASYATDEGLGAEVRWTRYNRLRRADTVSVLARASNLDSRLEGTVSLPHWRSPRQTFTTAASIYRVRTDAYDESGVGVRADVTRRFGPTNFLTQGSYFTYGGSLDFSRTDEVKEADLTPLGRDLITLAGLVDVSMDRSDDPLDPHRGWRISVRAEPTYIAGDTSLPYLRLQTQGSAYLPLGKADVIAGRLKLGSIVNGSIPEVPSPRRFYAGGGGSVRGFGYQAVGPRLADNTPQGGVSLLESSLEGRHRIGAKWEVVAFVDAGNVGSDQIVDFNDLAVGAGLGVRYHLPFAPVRFDVAVPVTRRHDEAPFQMYISVGQAF